MMGAPGATQVQLSPLPTSAMSDWYNKTQKQLGGLDRRKETKHKNERDTSSQKQVLSFQY